MISKKISITDEFIEIFGIKFLKGGYSKAINLLSEGGFMIVPSAPSLVIIKSDKYYMKALQACDFAIPDSGLMVLMMGLIYKVNLKKLSGLAFLESFLSNCAKDKSSEIFLVEPTEEDHVANNDYLKTVGVSYDPSHYYVAPFYSETVINDYTLLKQLEALKPKVIIINLGGGIQEKLGYYLKKNLSFRPAIICTGAAIAFLSGRQARIPVWADKLYLGWLFRCLSNPIRFIPRYIGSLKLVFMLMGCSVEDKQGG